MKNSAVILLAHLNPLTNAHEEIILSLNKRYNVYVLPVIFLKNGREITTRSFPFPYPIRKAMIESIFDGMDIVVLPSYSFESPFIKYFPPLISPFSWILRKKILGNVKENRFISYTGDTAERLMLRFYLMHPTQTKRLDISASNVKESLYRQAKTSNSINYKVRHSWEDMVPFKVANIIKDNWKIVERFANCPDHTIKIMGMKFPREGLCFS
ncbi:MAG: hypothetical protein ACTHKP_10385 [Nitrososphaeraceae archaeon]|jgi:nicotinic acid mononucleotide adenylyltransferase